MLDLNCSIVFTNFIRKKAIMLALVLMNVPLWISKCFCAVTNCEHFFDNNHPKARKLIRVYLIKCVLPLLLFSFRIFLCVRFFSLNSIVQMQVCWLQWHKDMDESANSKENECRLKESEYAFKWSASTLNSYLIVDDRCAMCACSGSCNA